MGRPKRVFEEIIRKLGKFYCYNVKNNYLCVFIWRKALKLNEIT